MLAKLALFFLASSGLTHIDERGYSALIANHPNQILLVSFWATWCDPCRAELAQLAALERQFPARNFSLAVISIDEPEQAREAQRIWGLAKFRTLGYLADPKNRETFINGVDPHWSGVLPALFLYDRPGHLVRAFTGEFSMSEVKRSIAGCCKAR